MFSPYAGNDKPARVIDRAIILAGGMGAPLKPVTNTIPQALVPVLMIPNIVYTIDLLRRSGIRKIIISLHHLGQAVEWIGSLAARFVRGFDRGNQRYATIGQRIPPKTPRGPAGKDVPSLYGQFWGRCIGAFLDDG